MPALGITVTEETVRVRLTSLMELPEFRRAYLNQWLDGIRDEWLVIPKESWHVLAARPVPGGEIALAGAASKDRKSAAIAAAWRRPDGRMDVEIVEHHAGTSWMPGRLAAIVRKHRPAATVVDAGGPEGSLIDETEALGVEVTKPGVREVAQGCGRFFDMVMDSRSLRHGDNPVLNAAVAGAVKRDLADAWAWDRKNAAVDISPLVAVTHAVWAHDKFAKRQAPYEMLRSVS